MDEGLTPLPLPEAGSPGEVLARTLEALKRGVCVVVATVVARRGSTPATPGQKLVLTSEGKCVGTVGGGALERSVLEQMLALHEQLRTGEVKPARDGLGPRLATFNLGAGLGMCCGGGVDVLLEPIEAARAILVVGAGHVASALAPSLLRLGFEVTVCDERDEWADPARLPGIRVVAGNYQDASRELPRSRTAVLVMTHDHMLDQAVAEWALREGFAFVGGIGSRAKRARIRARLEAKGFPVEAMERLRMPLGVEVGARTPEEIAVAVAAEMVAWRRATASKVAPRREPRGAPGLVAIDPTRAEG
jgi:xanthine dehydrogenase accessory factor